MSNVNTDKLLTEALNQVQQPAQPLPSGWPKLAAWLQQHQDDLEELLKRNAKNPKVTDHSLEGLVVDMLDDVIDVWSETEDEQSPEDNTLQNQIAERLTIVATEAGYKMNDILWYISEMEDSFEPSAYQNITDEQLLADFKTALKNRD